MRVLYRYMLAGALLAVAPSVLAADGALDPSFGMAGKAHIALTVGSDRWNLDTRDVAVQADGKILLVGGATKPDGSVSWFITRLKSDGTLDTGFGSSGIPGFSFLDGGSYSGAEASAVVMRPDGRFVVAGLGTEADQPNPRTRVIIVQYQSNGSFDTSFGNGVGYFNIEPAATDSVSVARMQLQADGSIDIVGTYYQNSGAYNGNQFFLDRINASGTNDETFRYQLGSGTDQRDQALDFSIDSHGRYVLTGYHLGANGNYDCAVIRVRNDLYDVDTSFGDNGQTIVAFDNGGDNNDYCETMAITPGGSILIGGHGTATVGSGTYQAAEIAMLDPNGNIAVYGCAAVCQRYQKAFAFNGNPMPGQSNMIKRLLIDNYDPRFPQAIAIGTGTHTGSPGGDEFAIARMNPAGNFHIDAKFNGGNVVAVDFVDCAGQFGNLITHNYAQSGAFAAGSVVAIGSTTPCAFGKDIAATRLAAFDSIFSYGFELPYY